MNTETSAAISHYHNRTKHQSNAYAKALKFFTLNKQTLDDNRIQTSAAYEQSPTDCWAFNLTTQTHR